ncbi:hypothetical protein ONZ45_g6511 [Pleurotus djamor]|nr:hypothetical protein ONZ45_g6511 [Pleurotus djamor]
MLSSDTFNASSTNVKVKCPSDMSGLERILVTAQGNLQRLLSTFFGKPIHVETVYSRTGPRLQPASPESPVRQDRQVLIKCNSHTVCIATSTVIITSPRVEQLFLDEKYPIGQLFRKLGVTPDFQLINVEVVYDAGRRELERTYKLSTEGVTCTILEVFPDRDMFLHGLPDSDSVADEEETQVQAEEALSDIPVATTFASEEFFKKVPHSPSVTLTLSSILEKQASDNAIGQRVFAAYPHVTEEGISYREITYSQLAKVVNYEASVWGKSLQPYVGGGIDSPVIAVLADSGFDYAVMVLALLKLNISVFLLAPANSEAAVKHLLSTSQVAALIYAQRHAAVAINAAASSNVSAIPYEDVKTFQYADVISGTLASENPTPLRDSPPEVPIIVHSSGSTAFPKPVPWSNTSFLSNSQVLLSEGGWSVFTEPDNRFLCLGPLFHTLGLTIGLANTICAGTTIVFPLTRAWPPSPTDIAKSFQSTKVTTCIIVPLLLEQLIGALEDSVGSLQLLRDLRLLITGGAHCPKSLAHRLINDGVNLKCIYGSSEAGHMMIGSHDRGTAREDSWDLLRPFPNTAIIFKPLDSDDFGRDNVYQVHMAPDDVRLAPNTIRDGASTWNTGDVVEESPAGSGWYRLLYRDDDILVHVSGEKTNPVPMEIACRDHKLIDSVAVIGHQRRVTAAIVQLDEAYAQRFSEDDRLSMVYDAIDSANREAPSHSRILHEMVFVIPFGYSKKLPKTPKGNCIRPKVLQQFSEEIDSLYRNFEDDGESQGGSSVSSASSATVVDVHNQVLSLFEDIVGHHLKSSDYERSLFDMGLDSVKAMQLRTRLAKFFETKLPQKFIYQNFTLSLLSAAIWERVSSRTNSPLAPATPQTQTTSISKGEILQTLINGQIDILQNSANLLKSSRLPGASDVPTEQVVAIVGAAGSLGVWQVKALLDQPDVKQVVCLVRGKDAAAVYDKMSQGFQNAKLVDLVDLCQTCKDKQLSQPNVPATNLDQRLAVVPFDLADAQFDQTEYYALASSLTTIIHTGWKMDFNQVVQGFEDCINGTTRLLILAAFLRPKHFYFISSIGTVLESLETPVPETLPRWTKDDYVRASPHGYSESKFVCEYLIEAASKLLDIPCSMARIGQIAGDSISGVWKVQEMNPIIIAGSSRIGKFPVVPGAIMDWVPVDVVGSTTAELATSKQPSSSVSVHHIVGPAPTTYGTMAEQLQEIGIPLSPVSPREWWDAIRQDEGNPCLAIEGYIEEAVVDALDKLGDKTSVTLDISNTIQASSSLSRCPPIDGSLWKKYIDYWKGVGFIAV